MDLATGAIDSLLPKLSELLNDEYKLKKSVKEGVKSLEMEMMSIHAALRNVAEMPRDQLDEVVKFWAGEVRELSIDMENIIDKAMVQFNEESDPATNSNKLKRLTKNMAGLFTEGKIAGAIKDFNKQLQEIADRRERYAVDSIVARPAVTTIDPRMFHFYNKVTNLVGIAGERDQELIKLLAERGNDTENKLKIVCVVGFGGLGKTTLVKIVYDKIKGDFDCTAFVHVGRNANLKKIFMDILIDLGTPQTELTMFNETQLINKLRESLQNKRYLIVIDDLWDEKTWSVIRFIFPSRDCGSQVITTTRVNKIADICCSGCKDLIYKIRPLGYQNSKRLFLKRCFGSEDSCHDAQTEVDEMLKICGGMPLAIISIASAISRFSGRKIKETCQAFMNSLHSAGEELDCVKDLATILSYSYFDLPITLRACLLYLAASAKNQRVQRDNMVRKWIAEGLIPTIGGSSRVEVARRYFDELVDRNVIHPVKYASHLGKETYEITYMMIYVLTQLSREENFATFLSKSEAHVLVTPFRLFIQCSGSDHKISTESVNLTNVWSVTMLGPANWVPFKHLQYVRVLDIDGCKDLDNSAMDDICLMIKLTYLSLKRTQVTEIPPEISNLQRLETLNVRNCQITTLPPQIGELQNLETLDVRHTQVRVLPKEVLQLRKLTHLHFGQIGSFGVKLPVGSHQLSSLEVMGNVDSRECSESAMEEISELTGLREVEVVLYDGPADMEQNDKLLSFVGKCSKLESLTIHGDSNTSDKLPLESYSFPQLEKLKVAGRFVRVPGWIGQLGTLTLLVLRVCKLEENDMAIVGGLPCLSVLSLELVSLPRKQVTITSSAGFASLKTFFFDCRVPWVSFEERAMPKLKRFQLKLYSAPAGKSPSGITLLVSLNKVILLYSSQYAASVGVIEAVDVVSRDAASHANQIKLSVNGDREIFLSNKTADRGVAGTSADGGVAGTSADGGVAGRVTTGAEIVEVLASE